AVGPAWFDQLLGAHHTQFAGSDVAADCAAGRDDGIRADRDRGNQRAVRADEGALADHRPVLEIAVVVAGDRARSDVRSRPHLCVAEVAQMVGLGPFAEHRVLDLDEVADLRALFQPGAGPQPRKRANRGAWANLAAI